MKTMSVGEFKTHFSDVLKSVIAGEEVGIMYGKKKEVVAVLVAKSAKKKSRRKIGVLEGAGQVSFGSDFEMTESEFLGL